MKTRTMSKATTDEMKPQVTPFESLDGAIGELERRAMAGDACRVTLPGLNEHDLDDVMARISAEARERIVLELPLGSVFRLNPTKAHPNALTMARACELRSLGFAPEAVPGKQATRWVRRGVLS